MQFPPSESLSDLGNQRYTFCHSHLMYQIDYSVQPSSVTNLTESGNSWETNNSGGCFIFMEGQCMGFP